MPIAVRTVGSDSSPTEIADVLKEDGCVVIADLASPQVMDQIRAELKIAKREWMRPLEAALASKKLTKKGEKRATTYFA